MDPRRGLVPFRYMVPPPSNQPYSMMGSHSVRPQLEEQYMPEVNPFDMLPQGHQYRYDPSYTMETLTQKKLRVQKEKKAKSKHKKRKKHYKKESSSSSSSSSSSTESSSDESSSDEKHKKKHRKKKAKRSKAKKVKKTKHKKKQETESDSSSSEEEKQVTKKTKGTKRKQSKEIESVEEDTTPTKKRKIVTDAARNVPTKRVSVPVSTKDLPMENSPSIDFNPMELSASSSTPDIKDDYLYIRVKADDVDNETTVSSALMNINTKLTDEEILKSDLSDLTYDERQKRKILKHRQAQSTHYEARKSNEGDEFLKRVRDRTRESRERQRIAEGRPKRGRGRPSLSSLIVPDMCLETEQTPQKDLSVMCDDSPADKKLVTDAADSAFQTPTGRPRSTRRSSARSTPTSTGPKKKTQGTVAATDQLKTEVSGVHLVNPDSEAGSARLRFVMKNPYDETQMDEVYSDAKGYLTNLDGSPYIPQEPKTASKKKEKLNVTLPAVKKAVAKTKGKGRQPAKKPPKKATPKTKRGKSKVTGTGGRGGKKYTEKNVTDASMSDVPDYKMLVKNTGYKEPDKMSAIVGKFFDDRQIDAFNSVLSKLKEEKVDVVNLLTGGRSSSAPNTESNKDGGVKLTKDEEEEEKQYLQDLSKNSNVSQEDIKKLQATPTIKLQDVVKTPPKGIKINSNGTSKVNKKLFEEVDTNKDEKDSAGVKLMTESNVELDKIVTDAKENIPTEGENKGDGENKEVLDSKVDEKETKSDEKEQNVVNIVEEKKEENKLQAKDDTDEGNNKSETDSQLCEIIESPSAQIGSKMDELRVRESVKEQGNDNITYNYEIDTENTKSDSETKIVTDGEDVQTPTDFSSGGEEQKEGSSYKDSDLEDEEVEDEDLDVDEEEEEEDRGQYYDEEEYEDGDAEFEDGEGGESSDDVEDDLQGRKDMMQSMSGHELRQFTPGQYVAVKKGTDNLPARIVDVVTSEEVPDCYGVNFYSMRSGSWVLNETYHTITESDIHKLIEPPTVTKVSNHRSVTSFAFYDSE